MLRVPLKPSLLGFVIKLILSPSKGVTRVHVLLENSSFKDSVLRVQGVSKKFHIPAAAIRLGTSPTPSIAILVVKPPNLFSIRSSLTSKGATFFLEIFKCVICLLELFVGEGPIIILSLEGSFLA